MLCSVDQLLRHELCDCDTRILFLFEFVNFHVQEILQLLQKRCFLLSLDKKQVNKKQLFGTERELLPEVRKRQMDFLDNMIRKECQQNLKLT